MDLIDIVCCEEIIVSHLNNSLCDMVKDLIQTTRNFQESWIKFKIPEHLAKIKLMFY